MLAKIFLKNWVLYFLILVFLLPIIAAFFLKYYVDNNTVNLPLKNNGKFVNSQVILPIGQYSKLDYPHWSLAIFLPGNSLDIFQQHIAEIAELRASLTKDIKRLELLSIGENAGGIYINIPLENDLDYYLSESIQDLAPGEIIVVDPRGELVLSFAADADKKIVMSELKHLLKVSQQG